MISAAMAALLVPAVPAAAAPRTVTVVRSAEGAVEGSLDGGEAGQLFFAPVVGLASFERGGGSFTTAAVDVLSGSVECFTEQADAVVTVSSDLSTAEVSGTVTGTCNDIAQDKSSSYSATFELTWTASGPYDRHTFRSHPEGQDCVTRLLARDAQATGTMTWSAPDLGIGGTGQPIDTAHLQMTTSRCWPSS